MFIFLLKTLSGKIWWRHKVEKMSALLALCTGSPMDSPRKGQWRGALMFSLMSAWTHGWANNRDAGDLGRHRAYYDVTVMRLIGLQGADLTIAWNGQYCHIDNVKTTSIEKESTVLLGKNKARFQTWKWGKQKGIIILWDICNYLRMMRI